MNPTLSIITLSWNSKRETEACLNALINTVTTSYEIIVVDNASTDGSVEMLKHFSDAHNNITVQYNAKNEGYAKGNLQALALASGEYILVLNSDTVPQIGSIDTLVDFLQSHTDYAGATAKLLNADLSTQYYMHRRFPTGLRLSMAIIHKRLSWFKPKPVRDYLYLNGELESSFDIEQAAGACILLRKSAINSLKYLFDAERFPLYYNDVDLCFRLAGNNMSVRYLADSHIVHHKGTSVRKLSVPHNALQYVYASLQFFAVHKRYVQFLLLWVAYLLSYLALTLASPVAVLLRRWKMKEMQLLLKGWIILFTLSPRFL